MLILAASFFKLTLPAGYIAFFIAFAAASNLLLETPFLARLPEERVIGTLLSIDTILLTLLLSLSGGPMNPFTIVYLLHVVLSAVLLPPIWTWAIAVLSCFGFASLFVISLPVPEWESHGAHHGFSLHLHGMLFSYVSVALLTAYFLNRIIRDLRGKERELERLEHIAASQQRLASLVTITAGAAHELSTPLSTIAVVCGELQRQAHNIGASKILIDDLELLRTETYRCKQIIQDLSARTGDVLGESPQTVRIADLVEEALAPLIGKDRVQTIGVMDLILSQAPRRALVMALRALVKNALEASSVSVDEKDKIVELEVRQSGGQVSVEVRDRGVGINDGVFARLGEPFFSTKPGGMGLGVYIARLTFEQLGGRLQFGANGGKGTMARAMFSANIAAQGPSIKEAA